MHMRETMISIIRGMTTDVVIGMAGGGEEAMVVGVAARSGMEEDTLGKDLGEVVIMVVEEGTEEDIVVAGMAVDTEEDMEVGTSIGGIKWLRLHDG